MIVKTNGMMTTGVQQSAINWPEPSAPPKKAAPRTAAAAAPAEGGTETEEQAKKRNEAQKKLDAANEKLKKAKEDKARKLANDAIKKLEEAAAEVEDPSASEERRLRAELLHDEFKREAACIRATLSKDSVAKVVKTLRELEQAGFQPKILQATELSQEATKRLEDLKAEIKELAESNANKLKGQEVGFGFNWVAAVEELEPKKAEALALGCTVEEITKIIKKATGAQQEQEEDEDDETVGSEEEENNSEKESAKDNFEETVPFLQAADPERLTSMEARMERREASEAGTKLRLAGLPPCDDTLGAAKIEAEIWKIFKAVKANFDTICTSVEVGRQGKEADITFTDSRRATQAYGAWVRAERNQKLPLVFGMKTNLTTMQTEGEKTLAKMIEWIRQHFEIAPEEEFGVRRETRYLKMHREILVKYFKWTTAQAKAGKKKKELVEFTETVCFLGPLRGAAVETMIPKNFAKCIARTEKEENTADHHSLAKLEEIIERGWRESQEIQTNVEEGEVRLTVTWSVLEERPFCETIAENRLKFQLKEPVWRSKAAAAAEEKLEAEAAQASRKAAAAARKTKAAQEKAAEVDEDYDEGEEEEEAEQDDEETEPKLQSSVEFIAVRKTPIEKKLKLKLEIEKLKAERLRWLAKAQLQSTDPLGGSESWPEGPEADWRPKTKRKFKDMVANSIAKEKEKAGSSLVPRRRRRGICRGERRICL